MVNWAGGGGNYSDKGGELVGYWNEQSITRSTPRTFKCDECDAEEEALPWGMEDLKGGTHFVYSLPEGWWHLSTRGNYKLFCEEEVVTIVGGEVVGAR